MKILVIGGGIFLGAAFVDAALGRGHALTVFNRGRSRSAWPGGVEAIVGDRIADLGALKGRRFDAVLDTSGYVPADVRASTHALLDACEAYAFVSSISAYASFRQAPLRESDALASCAGLAADDRDRTHYGPQKAACEADVLAAFGDRALIVRPGLVIGPHDPTGRFSHWPWRVMEGGRMLVPAVPDNLPLQCIDARDLGAWMVHLLEVKVRGVFHATGPTGGSPLTWPALIEACRVAALGRSAEPAEAVPVDEAFLLEQGVQPWSQLPLWLPSTDADHFGLARADLAHAERHGLVTRPIAETIADVIDEGTPPADSPRRAAQLTREREAELLRLYKARAMA